VIPLFPFYVQSMGGSARTVGVLLGCFSFTQLVATPFLGRLSDRLGRRPVILVSLAGNAASMVLFALATKVSLLPLLFASRILAGATAGNLSACQAAIADVTTGEERARGMGRLGAGIGLGLVLGPALGSTLQIGGQASLFAAISAENGDRLESVTAPGAASSVEVTGGTVNLPQQALVDLQGPKPQLVLTGLTHDLQGGATIQIVFNFAEAGPIRLSVPVEPRAYEYTTYSPPAKPAATATAKAKKKAHPNIPASPSPSATS